jgi:hypothetical protein
MKRKSLIITILELLLVLVILLTACGPDTSGVNPTANTATNNSQVTFANSKLEAAVRKAISKPSGTIYASDLAQLISLSVPEQHINNLA